MHHNYYVKSVTEDSHLLKEIYKKHGFERFEGDCELSRIQSAVDYCRFKYKNRDICRDYELFLLYKYRSGEEEYFDRLAMIYKHMIDDIIFNSFEYLLNSQDYEDVYQVSLMGLLSALRKFDYSKSVTLSGYLFYSVRFNILNYYRDCGVIKSSRGNRELYLRYKRMLETDYGQGKSEGSDMLIAEKLGVSEGKISECIEEYENSSYILSIEKMKEEMGFCVPDNDDLEDKIVDRVFYERIIDELDETERSLLRLKYFMDYKRADVMKALGLSISRYSYLDRRLKQKLKSNISKRHAVGGIRMKEGKKLYKC